MEKTRGWLRKLDVALEETTGVSGLTDSVDWGRRLEHMSAC